MKYINEKFKFNFYGIDIVIQNNSKNYFIIDFNYLPGYKMKDLDQL